MRWMMQRTERLAISVLMIIGFGMASGCAGDRASQRPVPRACATELPGLSAYTGDDCRTCENVHVAAPGDPRRCGLGGDRPGKTVADRDGDGVADANDICPDSAADATVLANGCERIELEGVVFALDSADLKPEANDALEAQLDTLKRGDDVRVEIAGHTDAQGASDYNRDLSLRRARSVRAFLVDHGIDPERLDVKGYGEDEPVASNETARGRERNRRVELRVLDRE